jgi:hypothetical protein
MSPVVQHTLEWSPHNVNSEAFCNQYSALERNTERSIMPLFQFRYTILDYWKVNRYDGTRTSSQKRSDELGCVLLGRWHEWGRKQGWGVVYARDAQIAYTWLRSWAEPCCDVELIPVLDDASLLEFRGAGSPPRRDGGGHGIGYNTPLRGMLQEPRPGETIYLVHFQFLASGSENFRANAKTFFRQFEPLEGVRIQARYHDLGTASGWMVAAATGEKELYAMFYALLKMVEVKVRPALTDRQLSELGGKVSSHYHWLNRIVAVDLHESCHEKE